MLKQPVLKRSVRIARRVIPGSTGIVIIMDFILSLPPLYTIFRKIKEENAPERHTFCAQHEFPLVKPGIMR